MNVAVKQIVDTQLGAELTEKEAWKLAGLMTIRELGSGDYLIEEGGSGRLLAGNGRRQS